MGNDKRTLSPTSCTISEFSESQISQPHDLRPRLSRCPFLDNFRIADQRARMRRVAARPGFTVALVANESINQHFKSHAENFCRW